MTGGVFLFVYCEIVGSVSGDSMVGLSGKIKSTKWTT